MHRDIMEANAEEALRVQQEGLAWQKMTPAQQEQERSRVAEREAREEERRRRESEEHRRAAERAEKKEQAERAEHQRRVDRFVATAAEVMEDPETRALLARVDAHVARARRVGETFPVAIGSTWRLVRVMAAALTYFLGLAAYLFGPAIALEAFGEALDNMGGALLANMLALGLAVILGLPSILVFLFLPSPLPWLPACRALRALGADAALLDGDAAHILSRLPAPPGTDVLRERVPELWTLTRLGDWKRQIIATRRRVRIGVVTTADASALQRGPGGVGAPDESAGESIGCARAVVGTATVLLVLLCGGIDLAAMGTNPVVATWTVASAFGFPSPIWRPIGIAPADRVFWGFGPAPGARVAWCHCGERESEVQLDGQTILPQWNHACAEVAVGPGPHWLENHSRRYAAFGQLIAKGDPWICSDGREVTLPAGW
jgi:hypothetical protein